MKPGLDRGGEDKDWGAGHGRGREGTREGVNLRRAGPGQRQGGKLWGEIETKAGQREAAVSGRGPGVAERESRVTVRLVAAGGAQGRAEPVWIVEGAGLREG